MNIINTPNTSNISININSKCILDTTSYIYLNNIKKYNQIMSEIVNLKTDDEFINIKVAFHMIMPKNSIDKQEINTRIQQVLVSLNEDFNSYNINPNIYNNFKYKSVVNTIFHNDTNKQNIYLSPEYYNMLPNNPSNISFDIGNIYYYPITNKLDLSQQKNMDVDMMRNLIKQYIITSQANNIYPDKLLNIWVVDIDSIFTSFSSFPWEVYDDIHGVIIHKRLLFPEKYNETNYNKFKSITHAIGHYLGLLHNYDQKINNNNRSINIHEDVTSDQIINNINDFPIQDSPITDPADRTNTKLYNNRLYNPLFMNFMDNTYDKYSVIFTKTQLEKMKFMIKKFRSNINSHTNGVILPEAKYDPYKDNDIYNRPIQNEINTYINRQVPITSHDYNRITSHDYNRIPQYQQPIIPITPINLDNGFFPNNEIEQQRYDNKNPNIVNNTPMQYYNTQQNNDILDPNILQELVNILDNRNNNNQLNNNQLNDNNFNSLNQSTNNFNTLSSNYNPSLNNFNLTPNIFNQELNMNKQNNNTRMNNLFNNDNKNYDNILPSKLVRKVPSTIASNLPDQIKRNRNVSIPLSKPSLQNINPIINNDKKQIDKFLEKNEKLIDIND